MQGYQLLFEQAKAHIDNTLPFYSVLSNISAVLNELENINWVGFYLVKDDTLYRRPRFYSVKMLPINFLNISNILKF